MESGLYREFVREFKNGYSETLQEIYHYGDETVERFRPSEKEVIKLKKIINTWDINSEQRTLYRILIRGMLRHVPRSYTEWDEDDNYY